MGETVLIKAKRVTDRNSGDQYRALRSAQVLSAGKTALSWMTVAGRAAVVNRSTVSRMPGTSLLVKQNMMNRAVKKLTRKKALEDLAPGFMTRTTAPRRKNSTPMSQKTPNFRAALPRPSVTLGTETSRT